MRQLVNIKKVTVDNELKATIVLEFIVSSQASRKAIFDLISMQGNAVEISFMPSQQELPVDLDR